MDLSVLDGTWAWVWKEPPQPVRFSRGLIVRAANGSGITDPGGFDFQLNYRRWREVVSGPLIAWTYLYENSDPVVAARMLAGSVAVAYLIDWEDAAGPAPSGERLGATVREIRRLRPGVPVGFCSYPTKAQAEAHGVDWDAGIAVCDFVAPQTYYGYQIADYAQILKDAGSLYVQLDLEPAVSDQWRATADWHLSGGQGVSFWRLGMLTAMERNIIATLEGDHDMTKADVIDAIRSTLHLQDSLAVPSGQVHNDQLAVKLLGAVQEQHNTLGAMASAINGLTTSLLELTAKVDQLAGPAGPAPAGGRVSGTFEGTIGDGSMP